MPPAATLLIGNGFSIAWNPKIFSYAALYDAARLPERIADIFKALGTSDFEAVMRRLDQTLEILKHYEAVRPLAESIREDGDLIRTSLIEALDQRHPAGSHQITQAAADCCARALAKFGAVFTTNYDLLLYWVYVRYVDDLLAHFDDGFRGDPLTWHPTIGSQSVFYLHGALHLFDRDVSTQKLKYGEGLISQVTDRLASGQHPLFVSEGSSEQKRDRIAHSAYLSHALLSLAKNKNPLTIYGHSLKENDEHICEAIEASSTPALAVYYHDEMPGDELDAFKENFRTLRERLARRKGAHVTLTFHASSSLAMWPPA